MIQLAEMRPADLASVFALVQRIDPYGVPHCEWLRAHTFGDETCAPDLLLLAKKETETVGFCFACLRGDRGVVKLFGVEKGMRRQGIGDVLLDAIETRLRERDARAVAVEGASPNFFLPGVSLEHTDAICFLLKRGYETDRVSRVDMDVDLAQADLDTSAAEALLLQKGIVIRRAQADEVAATADMALAHFSDAWRYEVSDTINYAPIPLFIALHEGRVVGFAAYDVGGPTRFGPTGTDPHYREQGIGAALLKLCLRDIRDRGDRIAEIGWAGPIGFYARAVGARLGRAYWCFHKPLHDLCFPVSAPEPPGHEDGADQVPDSHAQPDA